MDWKGALVENWPYKLAAFALALLLWFNVTAEEQQPQRVPTELRVVVQDTGWVLAEAPDEVVTTFQGRRGDLLGFSFERPVLRKVISEVTDSVMRVDLEPREVVVDPQLQARPVAVQPTSALLRFEPVVSRRLPVAADVRASPASGFTLLGSPLIRPESVEVRGAASQVEALSEVETEPLVLDGVRATETREVPLQLPPGLESLEVDSSTVLLTVEVDSLVERRLTVPVAVRGTGTDGFTASPEAVRVTIRGPRGVVTELTADDIGAVVRLDEPPEQGAEPRRLEVQVELPEGLSATATAEPPVVAVSRASEGG